MKLDNGTLFFYIPSFFGNPILILILGFIVGMVIMYLVYNVKSMAPSAGHKVHSFDSKMDMLSQMPTQHIIGRTRSLWEIVKAFNKINELVFIHKPVNNSAISTIQSSAAMGNRFIMNDHDDFYTLIGNWSDLKTNISSLISKIEDSSKSKSIANEEFRRDIIIEVSKIKENLNPSE